MVQRLLSRSQRQRSGIACYNGGMFLTTGITMTCFAASYLVTLVLEVSRILFHATVRNVVMLAFAAAGWFAHTLFLLAHARLDLANNAALPWSNWHGFCLFAAWVVAGAYLGLSIRRPQVAVGVFLLPLVLVLIGVAHINRDAAPFTASEAVSYWRWIHGLALLLGIVGVTLGFGTGVMHLIQSYRLKHKLPPNPRFKLPSLEWLQRFNREALFISAGSLAIGLIAGMVMNATSGGGIAWTHPVIVSSGILFLWLVAVLASEMFYRPAREGRKVAYLTVASFIFLGLVLYFVLFFQHGERKTPVAQSSGLGFPKQFDGQEAYPTKGEPSPGGGR